MVQKGRFGHSGNFADLNVYYDPQTAVKLAVGAAQLGWGCIAFNVTISASDVKTHKCIGNPNLTQQIEDNVVAALGDCGGRKKRVRVLWRLTIRVESVDSINEVPSKTKFKSEETIGGAGYDIIAVAPRSEEAWKALGISAFDKAIHLISFDLSSRQLEHPIYRKEVVKIMEAKRLFEVSFAPALASDQMRRNLFTNVLTLNTFTKGKFILMTSGAKDVMELRSPYDLNNFGRILGLHPISRRDMNQLWGGENEDEEMELD